MDRKTIINRWSLRPKAWHADSALSLIEALGLYRLQFLPSRNLARLTRVAYVRDLDALITWIEKGSSPTPLSSIDRRRLERYVAYLDQQGLTPSYRRRKVAAIRSFFAFLQQEGCIAKSPAAELRPPARSSIQTRVLSVDEYTRLRDSAKNEPRDRAIIELILQTGLLLSEVGRLRVRNIELPGGRITSPSDSRSASGSTGFALATGPNRRERTILLNWRACQSLYEYLLIRPECDSDRIFITKFYRGMGPRGIERVVEKYLALAQIPNASVQSLRHTYATHLLYRGARLKFVQEALGHESPVSTAFYINLARELTGEEPRQHAL